jgi:heme/copper-type cytochrome/quinol oxidase subunit 2
MIASDPYLMMLQRRNPCPYVARITGLRIFGDSIIYHPRHRVFPALPRLLDDVDMVFYANVRGCEFGTTRQPAPLSLDPSWGGGLTRRMHVTAGLMLPSDTPIHVICGSKDVIHSWAIPGLLIKIDCIPGYNAHRRLLIR